MFIWSFCFAIINNGVKVLNSNSVVLIKPHFAHGKSHYALHECLALMSMSKTTLLFKQKLPANGFKLN